MRYSDVILLTDLDGTLLDSKRAVSENNRVAIRRFIEQGGSFGISTGRAPANAKLMLPGVEINAWSIVINGAEAYHFVDKKAAYQKFLPQKTMQGIIAWALKEMPEVNIQPSTEDQLLFVSDVAYADPDFVQTHQPLTYVDLQTALVHPWMKVLFCGSRAQLERLERYATEIGATKEMDLVYTHTTYLEFLTKNINKGSCLNKLREIEDLRGKTFVGVGDYSNDLELLREADIAVAVGNALAEVKAIADHVICSNDEDAIAYLIDTVIPSL